VRTLLDKIWQITTKKFYYILPLILKNNENQNGKLSIRSRNRKNKQSIKLKTNVILRENFGATSFCQLAIFSNHKKYFKQGTLTEGEGSVQLISL
jgi:hypothetical protein